MAKKKAESSDTRTPEQIMAEFDNYPIPYQIRIALKWYKMPDVSYETMRSMDRSERNIQWLDECLNRIKVYRVALWRTALSNYVDQAIKYGEQKRKEEERKAQGQSSLFDMMS